MSLIRRKRTGEPWETVSEPDNGGSLPAWWTVVSTPGSELVTFAGRVIIDPSSGLPLTVIGDAADTQNFAFRINTLEGAAGLRAAPGNLILNPQGTPTFTALEIDLRDDSSMDTGEFALRVTNSFADVFTVSEKGAVRIETTSGAAPLTLVGLPTSDPLVAGQLWNSTGTVKVSAG